MSAILFKGYSHEKSLRLSLSTSVAEPVHFCTASAPAPAPAPACQKFWLQRVKNFGSSLSKILAPVPPRAPAPTFFAKYLQKIQIFSRFQKISNFFKTKIITTRSFR
jgi:hypothetical protein